MKRSGHLVEKMSPECRFSRLTLQVSAITVVGNGTLLLHGPRRQTGPIVTETTPGCLFATGSKEAEQAAAHRHFRGYFLLRRAFRVLAHFWNRTLTVTTSARISVHRVFGHVRHRKFQIKSEAVFRYTQRGGAAHTTSGTAFASLSDPDT